MRKLTLATAATLAALTFTAGQADASERCQEDEPCWQASAMGNRTGWQDGVWYEDGQATTVVSPLYTAHGVYIGPELDDGPYPYSGPDEAFEDSPVYDREVFAQSTLVSSTRVSVTDLVPAHAWEPMQVRAVQELLLHTDADWSTSDLSGLVSLWIYNHITLHELYLILA